MAEIVTLLVIKVPSNTVTKKPTDYLNVDINCEYRGLAQRIYFTAVVTQETLLGEFDEIGSTKKVVYVDLPSSDTLKPYTTRVPNLPLSGVAPKTSPYGMKIKAEGTFGTVEAGNKACLYVQEAVVEEFTLTITIDPPGGGTVTKSPNKTKYTYGESVTLTASPSSGYKFDHWSGNASGSSTTVSLYMNSNKTVTAHFTKVAPPKADIRNLDFVATKGTYEIGAKVPFTCTYEYKGKAQSGQLVLSLGTGVYPSFFTVQTYSPMAVAFAEAMDWVRKTITEGTFVLTAALEPGKTYNTRAKLETLVDLTQETDTDWGVITISTVPVGVSFQVSIWGTPAFGSYQKWWANYWDPGISNFVGDGKWYYSYQKISFSNVKTGGYLAVFLMRDSTVSPQYTSPTFQAVNGGIYQYDVQLGKVSKIG